MPSKKSPSRPATKKTRTASTAAKQLSKSTIQRKKSLTSTYPLGAPDPSNPTGPWRPTPEQLKKAKTKKVPDLIAPELDVLFCGINPGLYSAAVGHHFAGPGNLFWPTLFATGFTPRLMSSFDEPELLARGFGITNLCARASAQADELDHDELHSGARALTRKVRKFQPKYVAFLGLVTYRIAFERRKAVVGLQDEMIGSSKLWLLPNPSGLNAFHQPVILHQMFRDFYAALVADELITKAVSRETAPSLLVE